MHESLSWRGRYPFVFLFLTCVCCGNPLYDSSTVWHGVSKADGCGTQLPQTEDIKAANVKQEILSDAFVRKFTSRSFPDRSPAEERILNTRRRDSDSVPIITIKVAVHVLHAHEAQNISRAQIESQIDALNRDFGKKNVDEQSRIPLEFAGLAVDSGIRFRLIKITRQHSPRAACGHGNDMKTPEHGGMAPIDPEHVMNIWVCNVGLVNGRRVLGFAQFPGAAPREDGVVIGPDVFGWETGTVKPPLHLGRTAVHEVGHYLNLRHPWEGGACDGTDHVADTPVSEHFHTGCPRKEQFSCGSRDMTMNFMEYVDDACMNMFTRGQVLRMRSIFEEGGLRAGLYSERMLDDPPLSDLQPSRLGGFVSGVSTFGKTHSTTTTREARGYCSSKAGSSADEWIHKVQTNLRTLKGSSGSAQLVIGSIASVTVFPAWSGPVFDEGYRIWIDWNNDGDFEDADEQVLTRAASSALVVEGTFLVPRSAIPGRTTMRVSLKFDGVASACEHFPYGDVKDYTVDIVEYCASRAESDANEWIDGVQLISGPERHVTQWIHHASSSTASSFRLGEVPSPTTAGHSGGYHDRTDLTVVLRAGESHVLSVEVGGVPSRKMFAVWLDVNHNGIFDLEELIGVAQSSDAVVQISLAIPFTLPRAQISPRTARLRVSMKYAIGKLSNEDLINNYHYYGGSGRISDADEMDGMPQPCDVFLFGEVEDYSAQLLPPAERSKRNTNKKSAGATAKKSKSPKPSSVDKSSNRSQVKQPRQSKQTTNKRSKDSTHGSNSGKGAGTKKEKSETVTLQNKHPSESPNSKKQKNNKTNKDKTNEDNTWQQPPHLADIVRNEGSPIGTLCANRGQDSTVLWLQSVQLNQLTLTLGQGIDYVDATSQEAFHVTMGEDFLLTIGYFSQHKLQEGVSVWVDFNGDRELLPNERVMGKVHDHLPGAQQQEIATIMSVPHDAQRGLSILRVTLTQGAPSKTPCTSIGGQDLTGTVVDFAITIHRPAWLKQQQEPEAQTRDSTFRRDNYRIKP